MYFLTFLALLIGASVTSYAMDSEYLPEPLVQEQEAEELLTMCMRSVTLPEPECGYVSPSEFLEQIEQWREENLLKWGIDTYGKERNFQGPEIVELPYQHLVEAGGIAIPCDDICEQEKLKSEMDATILVSDTVTSDRVLEEIDRSDIRGHFFTPIDFDHIKTFEGCLLIEFYQGAYVAICGEEDLYRLEQRIGYLRFLLKQRDLGDGAGGPTIREFYRISMRGAGHRGQLSEAHYQLGGLFD